jgi:HD superfamily phosphohydrolase
MYWQVYLHKTSVAAEQMLVNTLKRAKYIASQGEELFSSPALRYFLYNEINRETFKNNPESLDLYLQLDDNDIWSALKSWVNHNDRILALLSQACLERRIFKVETSDEPFMEEYISEKTHEIMESLNVTEEDVKYLTAVAEVGKDMYDISDDRIEILQKDGTTKDITDTSDMLNISTLSRKVRKYYFCRYRTA